MMLMKNNVVTKMNIIYSYYYNFLKDISPMMLVVGNPVQHVVSKVDLIYFYNYNFLKDISPMMLVVGNPVQHVISRVYLKTTTANVNTTTWFGDSLFNQDVNIFNWFIF